MTSTRTLVFMRQRMMGSKPVVWKAWEKMCKDANFDRDAFIEEHKKELNFWDKMEKVTTANSRKQPPHLNCPSHLLAPSSFIVLLLCPLLTFTPTSSLQSLLLTSLRHVCCRTRRS
eukprot:765749-Hanusia_phi.AAC.3